MGDHRATIKVEFDMHGHKAKQEMYINWDYHSGCDRRVVEWFEEQSAAAMEKWHAEQYKANEQVRAVELERTERAELARLEAKYSRD